MQVLFNCQLLKKLTIVTAWSELKFFVGSVILILVMCSQMALRLLVSDTALTAFHSNLNQKITVQDQIQLDLQ